jgi:hypothetical protein
MSERPQAWHYGLVARWWAEFGADGPDTVYFRGVVEQHGQSALDVDRCDISPDMLALCRQQAGREGLSVNLYEQAMHELDLPRMYKTVFIS